LSLCYCVTVNEDGQVLICSNSSQVSFVQRQQ